MPVSDGEGGVLVATSETVKVVAIVLRNEENKLVASIELLIQIIRDNVLFHIVDTAGGGLAINQQVSE